MDPANVKILVVDDDEIVRESLSDWFEEDGYSVGTACDSKEALAKLNEARWDIYFLDIKMPGMDGLELHKRIKDFDKDAIVIIITAFASVDTAVNALKDGAFDYVTKPFDPDSLTHIIRNAIKQRNLTKENLELKESLESLTLPPEIIGQSKHIREIQESIKTVAATNTTVMIRGESGTGKELVAQSIHFKSNRKFAPMVSVNCGALSETLLESELFGHERGSFTGAHSRRKGKLEIADGGTLFLDEIGSIQTKTQIDLLRAIDAKEFTRLGGNEIIKSDFRIVCATNTNLEEAVKKGEFREDLYYRLQVYTIYLKPLRERSDDIPELVNHFIRVYNAKMNKKITGIETSALNRMINFSWQGNIRELENTIERAMVSAKGIMLSNHDFAFINCDDKLTLSQNLSLAEVEKRHIIKVLDQTDWNISQTAKILEIDRATIYTKLQKYGISRPD
ncbi:MAG: sigma-54-dependent Fis family transcriptional regulator [Melioribacteraceae bacterium]|nr:sigma-54-dependent Fis family transcriptional regulator [Melioribacteraceae bacterium]